MFAPLQILFDNGENVTGAGVVHFPKLLEGAPYSVDLRVRTGVDELEQPIYRDWSAFDEMTMSLRLKPNDPEPFLVLKLTEGNFAIAAEQLTLQIAATDWEGISLPTKTVPTDRDVPFACDIDFYTAGTFVERFAVGYGSIVTKMG